jgi:hypothetical protein
MTISVSDVPTLLNSGNLLTNVELTNLANQLSVSAEGKVTVLYGQSARKLAE